MDALSFQAATQADRDAVWAIWHACILDVTTCWTDDYPSQAFLADDLAKGYLFVLKQGDTLLGSVTMMPADDIERQGYPFATSDQVIMFTRLCIDPAQQRRGYGRILLSFAEAHALANGAKAVHLLCDVHNQAGLALYAGSGYHEVCFATLYGDSFSVREKQLLTV